MSVPTPDLPSRQQAVGTAARAETCRRLLVAGGEEFAERGYTAATVARVAQRAGFTVQTLYLAWGSKRALLRGYIEAVLADSAGSPEAIAARFAGLAPSDVIDELATTLGEVATRSAVAWKLYRDAAAVDAEIAVDWHELQSMRRVTMRRIMGMIPADALRAGLSADSAVDAAWVIASPESYDLLVRTAGRSMQEYVDWMASTLRAAILG